jgi:hypothetical protein
VVALSHCEHGFEKTGYDYFHIWNKYRGVALFLTGAGRDRGVHFTARADGFCPLEEK